MSREENAGLLELIEERTSVRNYDTRPVEREKLEALAEAFRLAPSASNSQPWRIIFVDEPELKDSIARATFARTISFNKFAAGAPAIAVIVIEPPRLITSVGAVLKRRDFPLIDIGIATAQLILRAVELDLGTCVLGWFDEGKIKKLLGIPKKKRLALVVTIGYPAEHLAKREKTRKPIESVRSYNAY